MNYEIIWKGNEHTNSSSRSGYIPFVNVCHISAGTMASMDSWFTSAGNTGSSAHFGVSKTGAIHQYVDIRRMAWANGIGALEIAASLTPVVHDNLGVNPNLYSVSIEHEGMDGNLTEAQFRASAWLHRYIRDEVVRIYGTTAYYVLDEYHVIGHRDISKGKPACPGAYFPFVRLYAELAGVLAGVTSETEEDETNMPMKLEQWQWDMLYTVMGAAYNTDQLGWDWMQKVVDKTLTASELAFLNTVLDGRIDRNIAI
ncbi:N-acetylmuramoyl-L-alanine amidase [Paenibacillus agricola]|uniref:N-acetylmuramoyl-L-alanine amidase n=1 Tax=Paenibacillus agricola TaxID=2716264 RepID=A0ABX0J5N9_9BACL|nr:peptidoglycan recognition family protein [Paenibacillus agricola]NHN31116.1 N-acetylmuramoyl-L-alanine amidase [Paenibacillus agricola]